MPPDSMGSRLAELDAYLARARPDLLPLLRPPATETALEELRHAIGAPSLGDAEALFRWHDGQAPRPSVPLVFNYTLLSAHQAAEVVHCSDGMLGRELDASAWDRWVPVLDNGAGDFVCVALRGVAGGPAGEVLEVFHEEPRELRVVAPHLAEYLHWIVALGDAGLWKVSDAGVEPAEPTAFEALSATLLPGWPRRVWLGEPS